MSAPTMPNPEDYPPGKLHCRAMEDWDRFLDEIRRAEVIVGAFPEGGTEIFFGRELIQIVKGLDDAELSARGPLALMIRRGG